VRPRQREEGGGRVAASDNDENRARPQRDFAHQKDGIQNGVRTVVNPHGQHHDRRFTSKTRPPGSSDFDYTKTQLLEPTTSTLSSVPQQSGNIVLGTETLRILDSSISSSLPHTATRTAEPSGPRGRPMGRQSSTKSGLTAESAPNCYVPPAPRRGGIPPPPNFPPRDLAPPIKSGGGAGLRPQTSRVYRR
jgi:hypothetical protein